MKSAVILFIAFLVLLAVVGTLTGCGTVPAPELVVRTVTVSVPVARSCVPAGLPAREADVPMSLDALHARLAATTTPSAFNAALGDIALALLKRVVQTEPVIAGCVKP